MKFLVSAIYLQSLDPQQVVAEDAEVIVRVDAMVVEIAEAAEANEASGVIGVEIAEAAENQAVVVQEHS